MLKLLDKQDSKTISVEVDEYVPFTVEFDNEGMFPPLYWRCGDGTRSLLEIGLERKSGVLRSITLTSIDPCKIQEVDQELPSDFPEAVGCPIFDTTHWGDEDAVFSSSFHDEIPSLFVLLIGRDYLSLKFEMADNPVRYVRNGGIRFGINLKDELATIDLLDITDQEKGLLLGAQRP